jgi:hypothetical protein
MTKMTRLDFLSNPFFVFYFSFVYNWLVWVGSSGFIDCCRLLQNCSGEQLTGDSESIKTCVWSKRADGSLDVCKEDLLCLLFHTDLFLLYTPCLY